MARIFISIVAGSFLVSHFVSLRIQIIKHIPYAVFYTGSSYGSTMALLPIIVQIKWFGMAETLLSGRDIRGVPSVFPIVRH
ncbi:hypothetical protein BJ322DRAFT_309794 [Thelephora terrestris]|uniref:Uncharacterized protein n=1 Tax=Thelephora terrestris TaxID=56493 RepID=A0A9P6H7W3_9AGAM|nr:hypothetical protein BJ322DRAFT_309794 [Thelephora terrestris]